MGTNQSAEKFSKGQESKRKNIARLMLWTIYERNVGLRNALDVDLKITCSQNVQSHQKITKNGEIKYVLMKKVIMHATTAKITATKGYMHLWYECLAMMNVIVNILEIVRN